MTTQRSPCSTRCPCGQRPRREGDSGKGEQNTPRLTPTSTAKAANATRNHVPPLQALPDDGRPGGRGVRPARAVMTLPQPAARQAGRAGRCRGGGEAAYPAAHGLVEPDGLAADHVWRIARDPAGGHGDDSAEVGLLDSTSMSMQSTTAFTSTRSTTASTSTFPITSFTSTCSTTWFTSFRWIIAVMSTRPSKRSRSPGPAPG